MAIFAQLRGDHFGDRPLPGVVKCMPLAVSRGSSTGRVSSGVKMST